MQHGPQVLADRRSTFPTWAGGTAAAGLGYQAASLIAGGPAPLLATWMLPTFGWQAIAVYIIACVVITLAAAALLPDRSKTDLTEAPVLEPAGGRRRLTRARRQPDPSCRPRRVRGRAGPARGRVPPAAPRR